MTARIVFVGVFVALAAPSSGRLAARVPPSSAQQLVGADAQHAAIKWQVKQFETLLRNAVTAGGRVVAEAAFKIDPTITLVTANDPEVRGWWEAGVGYTFYVETPDILSSNFVALMMRQRSEALRPRPGSPVGATGSASSTDARVPPATPTGSSGTVLTATDIKIFDPFQVYSDGVRAALYDVILDNSSALPIKEGERLTVATSPTPLGNPLMPDSRKLVLTISAADMLEFRKGTLSREQARDRIRESRF